MLSYIISMSETIYMRPRLKKNFFKQDLAEGFEVGMVTHTYPSDPWK